MLKTHVSGFPRIGEQRELKFALEAYWRGEISQEVLEQTAQKIRQTQWQHQIEGGLDFITVGDFSFYDHVADHIELFGCIPARFKHLNGSRIDQYFAMVRGVSSHSQTNTQSCCGNSHALEMTKWFDTNYHYMVPEFDNQTTFELNAQSLLNQVGQAQTLNHPVKVTLLGPISFLRLGKSKSQNFDAFDLLDDLVAEYARLFKMLKQAGVQWVQLDEPALGLDLDSKTLALFEPTLLKLKTQGLSILLGTYFSELQGQISQVCKLPVDGLHVDGVRANNDLPSVFDWLPNYKVLSLGLIDGRNIWKTDLLKASQAIKEAFDSGKNEVWLSTSCSLLHVPYRLSNDTSINPEVRRWLAGAYEKLDELALLKQLGQAHLKGVTPGENTLRHLDAHQSLIEGRKKSGLTTNASVRERLNQLSAEHYARQSPFKVREKAQSARLNLPALPTTTIGSFPQTREIRQLRKNFKSGVLGAAAYDRAIKAEIAQCIAKQEALGLDVLVHGEAERNDMVEFFGEQLEGFTFSQNGWVQSYGSRCVKPPILFGDVQRTQPMTVNLATYAQSLSKKPVKGMLTGPVTILQWSFVRDDQIRAETARQIALAIRDEVRDLEAAGIRIIQIDEPAYREGLPLRNKDKATYLKWATECFSLSASVVRDDTQIHTHMCYAEFNDILPNIAAMDADVITIETSRSDMELLKGFGQFKYPNQIGPGVYDIHSPQIPTTENMIKLINKAAEVIHPRQLWINPDCGLKTRAWSETSESLRRMVQAARLLRTQLGCDKLSA